MDLRKCCKSKILLIWDWLTSMRVISVDWGRSNLIDWDWSMRILMDLWSMMMDLWSIVWDHWIPWSIKLLHWQLRLRTRIDRSSWHRRSIELDPWSSKILLRGAKLGIWWSITLERWRWTRTRSPVAVARHFLLNGVAK